MVPTYNQIKERVRQRYERSISHDCYIAEAKRKQGLTRGPAWNTGMRTGAPSCPPDIWKAIESVLRECNAI